MNAERPDPLKQAMAACRRVWMSVALFSACLNLLMLSVPLYMMQLYDRVLATGHVDTLLALTSMVALALLVLGLLDGLRGRIMTRVGAWLDRELGSPILAGAVHSALRGGSGMSAQGLRDLTTVRGFLGGTGAMPLFDAPWAPIFLGAIFLIHPVLGWIGLGGAVVLAGCAVLNDLTTRAKLAEASGATARALNAADTAVRNADTVAAMGMLPDLTRRWQDMGAKGQRLLVSASDRATTISAIAKTARFGLQVTILGVGAYLTIRHEMTAGGMIAAAIILARGLAPVEQLVGMWRLFVDARTAWRRLRDLMAHGSGDGDATRLPRPAGRIDLERVGFIPSGGREPVLRQVGFRLDAGDALGIVGPSGAGKTTLVRLIVGTVTPTAGHVRLDGAEVTAWPASDRGRYVGYLPQEVELFTGTVRENIARLGAADDDAVITAAQLAGAHEVILGLPQGYDTPIGEGGVPISGGQRQRIALARAVFGHPALLVLDEPNAHLDAEGEQALLATVARMRRRGVTVILIAQRTGVLAQVDKLLVVQGGVMTAFGARDEILASLRTPAAPAEAAGSRAPPALSRRAGRSR